MKDTTKLDYMFSHFPNIGLSNNFFSENPQNDINQVRFFIDMQHQEKILHIRSDVGNGGTHLLSGVAEELIIKKIKFASLSYERIIDVYSNYQQQFKNYLNTCEYCFIDYLDYAVVRPLVFRWLKDVLIEFMDNGGKLVLSTSYKINKQEIINNFKTNLIIEAKTTFQPLEVLKLIGKTYVSDRIVEENANEVFLKSKNIREFIGYLISIQAREEFNKWNIK